MQLHTMHEVCMHEVVCESVAGWEDAQQASDCISYYVQLSPLIDRTVLKAVKAGFGGRVRFVVSGGAPLGPSVETFLNITLCCPVLQVCKWLPLQASDPLQHSHADAP